MPPYSPAAKKVRTPRKLWIVNWIFVRISDAHKKVSQSNSYKNHYSKKKVNFQKKCADLLRFKKCNCALLLLVFYASDPLSTSAFFRVDFLSRFRFALDGSLTFFVFATASAFFLRKSTSASAQLN